MFHFSVLYLSATPLPANKNEPLSSGRPTLSAFDWTTLGIAVGNLNLCADHVVTTGLRFLRLAHLKKPAQRSGQQSREKDKVADQRRKQHQKT